MTIRGAVRFAVELLLIGLLASILFVAVVCGGWSTTRRSNISSSATTPRSTTTWCAGAGSASAARSPLPHDATSNTCAQVRRAEGRTLRQADFEDELTVVEDRPREAMLKLIK